MDTSRKWIPKRNQLGQFLAVQSQQQRHGTYKTDSAQVDWWKGTKKATSNKGLDLLPFAGIFCSCCLFSCDITIFALQAARKSAPTTGGVKKVLVIGKHLVFVSLCRVKMS